MTKYLSGLVLIATIIVAACSGGGSPAANPPSNPTSSSWAITDFSALDSPPYYPGAVITIRVAVTEDGAAPPDGTSVTVTAPAACAEADADGNFPCGLGAYGATSRNLATADGEALTSFVSREAGSWSLSARVNTVSRNLQLTYQNREQSDTLIIEPPLQPNEGSYDGGESVTINGKGISVPVEVDFVVGGITYPAVIVEVNESAPLSGPGSVTIKTPHITDVDRTQASSANVAMRTAVGTSAEQTTTLSAGFTYLAEAEFQIYQPLRPNRGLYDGAESVSMTGIGIREDVEVKFVLTDGGNEFPAIVSSVQPSNPLSSTGTITVQTPFIPEALRIDGSGSPIDSDVDVVVTTYEPSGDSFTLTLQRAFTYVAEPEFEIYQPLVPNRGEYDGGESVSMSGTGIRQQVEVTFVHIDSGHRVPGDGELGAAQQSAGVDGHHQHSDALYPGGPPCGRVRKSSGFGR
jgi:hypothetical protein